MTIVLTIESVTLLTFLALVLQGPRALHQLIYMFCLNRGHLLSDSAEGSFHLVCPPLPPPRPTVCWSAPQVVATAGRFLQPASPCTGPRKRKLALRRFHGRWGSMGFGTCGPDVGTGNADSEQRYTGWGTSSSKYQSRQRARPWDNGCGAASAPDRQQSPWEPDPAVATWALFLSDYRTAFHPPDSPGG